MLCNVESRFIDDLRSSHMNATRRIVRYLKETQNFGVLFSKTPKQADAVIDCYPDVDWSGVQVDRRSTASYIFKFLGAPIPWCSKKQSVM